ncbi:MAG: aminoglycoside phosphotransferase family protein [Lachnospiraceae bacterium]|nr:aminoglycoside phosphotransferase family protein [Lachnospiraceae bacterium]
MKQVFVVFDDRPEPPAQIRQIIGSKSFGNVILRRRTLRERLKVQSGEAGFILFERDTEKVFSSLTDGAAVIHLFSSAAVADEREYRVILQKAAYAEETYQLCAARSSGGSCPCGAVFRNKKEWKRALEEEPGPEGLKERFGKYPGIRSDAFFDLTDIQSFLSFLTSGFEARFFNRLDGDEFTVTKRSENREKIRAEYEFYRLLPDSMKPWFVMPYDYSEDDKGASYTMERMHMTDLAVRFVHGAIGKDEFERILSLLFRFISGRSAKISTGEEAEALRKRLYIDKVKERIKVFLSIPEAKAIEAAVAAMSPYASLQAIENEYEELYETLRAGKPEKNILVIGHGDLCFSNILYQPDADFIRFIDPRGGLKEEDIWTDPYYDVAKLSHSACGGYDLINSAQYQIVVDSKLNMALKPDMDTGEYAHLFRKYAQEAGFRFELVRLFECSLFLSMLPLHIDRPQKVLAFILNAASILKELKENG